MSCLAIIDAERLAFAKLVTDAARRTGSRAVENVELIGSGQNMFFIAADLSGDLGQECVIHGLELPPGSWSVELESHLLAAFGVSAELAIRNLPRATA